MAIKERQPTAYFTGEAQLLNSFLWRGEFDELLARGQAFVTAARQRRDISAMLLAAPAVGQAFASKGRYRDAERVFRETRDAGKRYRNAAMYARTTSMATGMWLATGLHARARELASEAREEALSAQFAATVASASVDLFLLAVRNDAIGEADRLLDDTRQRVAGMAGKGWHGWLFATRLDIARAELALAKRDHGAAIEHARAALELADRHGRTKYIALGAAMLGRVLLAAGQREAGLAALHRGVATARALGDPAVLLRTLEPLLDADGSDALLTEARDTARSIALALPADASEEFLASVSALQIIA
jgi:tetratricopeptide (TPR) repeat protein